MNKNIYCPQCNHSFNPDGGTRNETDSASDVVVSGSGEPSLLSERASRGRRSPQTRLIRWTVGSLLLIGFTSVAVFLATREPGRNELAVQEPVTDSANGDERPRPAADSTISKLERGVVRIETKGLGEVASLGAGFVIDESGLIATNYHVVSEATNAEVRFKDGATYNIEGYVAVEPERDLAIVKLAAPPPNLVALKLGKEATDPAQLAPVAAIGHPMGVGFSWFDGKVSRVVSTSQLPSRSRDFLRQLLGDRAEHRWIQHTAFISEGYSGGPLMNRRGEVIGINTWVDKQASFGYALHVNHLRELQRNTFSEVAPLARFARKDARIAAMLADLTSQRIDDLLDRGREMNWRPATETQYAELQQLAWAVTVANLPGTLAGPGGLSGERLESLTKAADRVVVELKKSKWNGPGQLLVTNDFAARHVFEPLEGVFLFGTVKRIVEGDDRSRGMLMELAGTETTLFIPLEGQLSAAEPGTQCLVLGVNYDGQVVRFGDNPLKPITAPVIATRTILPLE